MFMNCLCDGFKRFNMRHVSRPLFRIRFLEADESMFPFFYHKLTLERASIALR